MGGDDLDALIEVLRPLVERHGRERIEQALRQISPRARGRPRYSDDRLMLEALYLWQTGRFYNDPNSAYEPVKSTNAALWRTVEKFWSVRLGASKEAVHRRLWTRFQNTPFALDDDDHGQSSSWPGWRPPLK
jgi:hypothetical protein